MNAAARHGSRSARTRRRFRLDLILTSGLAALAVVGPAGSAFAAPPVARLDDGRAFHAQAIPPGAPGRPTAVAGDGQATVTIVPPTSGGTVSSYRVRVTGDNNSQCPLAVNERTCVVSGLLNGFPYTFQTVAYGIGDSDSSPWSASSAPVTPTAGGGSTPTPTPTVSIGVLAAPANVSLYAGTASMTAAWNSVAGATSYTATAHPGPAACTVTGTTCVLGATSETPYTVTVVAHSSTGDSLPSLAPAAVTPRAPVIPALLPSTASPVLTTDQGQIGLATGGQTITAIGSGFAPYSTVTLAMYPAATDLGDLTTTASGGFSQRVTLPGTLAVGSHTLLAAGADPQSTVRQISLPLTVASDTMTSKGTGAAVQTARLPIPASGTVSLLDENGLATTTVTTPGGTHTLNRSTGVISFVPVDGFTTAASSVRYRITDAVGTVVNGIYTPTVIAEAGAPVLKLPSRIVSSSGDDATAPVPCAISGGAIARCVVTATAVVSGRSTVIGYGVKTPTPLQNLQQVNVSTVLTELGRFLAARPGGVRATFATELIQREQAGSTTTKGATNLLAKSYDLPRTITFGVDSSAVGQTDAAYLNTANDKLAGAATSITCTGHADSRESGRSTLGLRRARATCAALAQGLDATVHTSGTVDAHPVGEHNTPALRARNRRVDVTVTN
jgi:CshA-type fibril repeat protein